MKDWRRNWRTLEKTNLWNACSYYLNSSNVLSIVILDSSSDYYNSYIDLVAYRVNKFLNIPVVLVVGYVNLTTDTDLETERSHLLIAPNSSSLILFFKRAKNFYPQNVWRAKENFFFLMATDEIDNKENYHNIFDHLWQERGYLNILILVKSLLGRQVEYILAYNPFKRTSNDGKTLMWTVRPDNLHNIPYLYNRMTRNLHGYTLHISMFTSRPTTIVRYNKTENSWYSEGRDEVVLRNIAAHMNFKAVIIDPGNEKIGFVTENGTLTGAMGKLAERRADILFNEIYLKYYHTDKLEFTVPPIHSQEIVVIVPKSAKIHFWVTIYTALKSIHWKYILISFISCCIVLYFMRIMDLSKRRGNVYRPSLCISSFTMLAIFVNMPLSFLTKIQPSSQRLFLASCLICSWFMMCNFQGLLLDIFANPHYDVDINTLSKLYEADFPILTDNYNLLDTFNGSESMEQLAPKLEYNENVSRIIREIKTFKNISVLCSRRRARWFLNRNGRDGLHIVNEVPRTYFVSYMVPKGSPYLRRLSVVFGRIAQAGLFDKWDSDAASVLYSHEEIFDDDFDSPYSVITLSDVTVALLVLVTGLLGCMFVFVCECFLKDL
ncbi:hypothetical protein ANN_12857 [Periplaneta americana]|uniref:Uncharacterized protein n=1 Tax=Periplaneta americana TaxID=6978 RepID=A0ABQ8TJW2_PERAM|nr:hypothetical protein ANN_12857 [Periplaneta americana]